jgi:hypothetical protein
LAVRVRDGRIRRRHADLGQFRVSRDSKGRVKVYGGSPGCLLVSIAVSVALTIFLNVLIRLF